jgi:transposase
MCQKSGFGLRDGLMASRRGREVLAALVWSLRTGAAIALLLSSVVSSWCSQDSRGAGAGRYKGQKGARDENKDAKSRAEREKRWRPPRGFAKQLLAFLPQIASERDTVNERGEDRHGVEIQLR